MYSAKNMYTKQKRMLGNVVFTSKNKKRYVRLANSQRSRHLQMALAVKNMVRTAVRSIPEVRNFFQDFLLFVYWKFEVGP